ncbi:MAG: hypothetical protein ABFD25_20310 [Clostridiaceae bacterium]
MNSMNRPVVLFPMRLQLMKKEGERLVPVFGGSIIDVGRLIDLSKERFVVPDRPKKGTGTKIPSLPAKRMKAVDLNSKKAREWIGSKWATANDLLHIDRDIFEQIEYKTVQYRYYQIRWYPDACQAFNPVRPVSDKENDAYQIYRNRCTGVDEEDPKAALAEFISVVGSGRARHIILSKEKGIDPSDYADTENEGAAGKSRFKMLPDSVKIFTVKNVYITNGIPFEIKELSADIRPIPEDLGISLEELSPDSQSWINDFSKAVSVGMGVEVSGENQVAQIDTADWLLVVGFSGDDSCDGLIRELFMRKRAAGALEVIRQDCPTNNSEDEKSGLSSGKMKTDEFSEMMSETGFGLSAANILGAIFGFEAAQRKEAFGYLKNGNSLDQLYAMDTFALMYPGCTAEFWKAKIEAHRYIELPIVHATAGGTIEIVGYETKPNPGFEEYAASMHHHEFAIFEDLKCFVSARGSVPPVLIDRNPYGILPVRCLPFWVLDSINEPGNIHSSMGVLSEIFNRKRFESRYFGVTGRYSTLQSIADRLEANSKALPIPDKIFTRALQGGAQSFADQEAAELTMPVVQEGDLSSLKASVYGVEAYLRSLNAGNPASPIPQVLTENPLTANSLLVAIVKKSLVQMKEIFDFGDCKEQVLGILVQMKTAADLLAGERGPSIAELEVLVKETLDIFSPRYDAWMLALSARRLLETDRAGEGIGRNGTKAGQIPDVPCLNKNLTGVFGWLENPGNAPSTHKTDGYFQTPSANQTVAASMIRNASFYSAEGQNPFMVNLSSLRYKEAVWFIEGMQKGYSRAELLGMRLERLLHDQGLDRLLYSLRNFYPLDQAGDLLKCSYLVNGEAFLEDEAIGGKGFSAGDLDVLKQLQNKIGELSDNASDLIISEIAYNISAGNTETANAWLSAFENKLPPPKVNMAATVRTGQVLMQRLVLPLDGGEAGAAEKNPRSIAEPSLARISDTLLSAFGYGGSIRFTASVYMRSKDVSRRTKLGEVSVSPAEDLGLSAFDIVLGGRRELDALAKRFVLHSLHGKGQDVDGALKAKNPEDAFDSKAYILFDYAGGMDRILAKASELLMLIRSSQPLKWDDVAISRTTAEESFQIRVTSLKTLYSRLSRLSESYLTALDELISLKTNLAEILKPGVIITRPGTAESRIKAIIEKINALLDKFVKFGFQEANIYLYAEPGLQLIEPGPGIKTPVIEKLESLIERLQSRKIRIIMRDILKYPLNETVTISYDMQQDRFIAETGAPLDESAKTVALNGLLEKVQNQLKEWTARETMVILPPFICRKARTVSGGSSSEQLETYRRVRKNISVASSLTDRFTTGLQHSVWEPGILESVEAVRNMVMKNVSQTDAAAVMNDLKALKLEGRNSTDLHYLLCQNTFSFTAGSPFAGLKIDEWSDFIHNKSEVTGVGLKCQTPKSQAPNVILIAVPEYQYPSNSAGQWTHLQLVRHMTETLRLMFIRTEGFNKEAPVTADPSQPGNENAAFVDNAAPVLFVKSNANDPLLK